MYYTKQKIMDFVEQEDVKFIRLAFCDIFGAQKNISIMPSELRKAFDDGISFDASAIAGFSDEAKSDLFLVPDSETLMTLPWRPTHGRVVRLYCDIKYPDGRRFERDGRYILKQAVSFAKSKGITCKIGAEFEFYLFKTNEQGECVYDPYDAAGYMDIAPEDKGENVRREICLALEEMGIQPETSHHEEGPGQNEIDFKYSDVMTAADNATTFKSVVKAIANQNGLWASFSPKPLMEKSGNGMHINISVKSDDGRNYMDSFMAGILCHINEMTVFLNPCDESYKRLGEKKAPQYITWSPENRSQLIRIPAARGEYERMELRSPDPFANPYIAFALLIYAGLDGIEKSMTPPVPENINLYNADKKITDRLELLPQSFKAASRYASESKFIEKALPKGFLQAFLDR